MTQEWDVGLVFVAITYGTLFGGGLLLILIELLGEWIARRRAVKWAERLRHTEHYSLGE